MSEFKSQNLLQLPGLLNTNVNEISTLKRQIADKETEQTQRRLNRDLEVQHKIYSERLDRYECAKITGALGAYEQRGRIKIIDETFEPSAPVICLR